MINIIIIIKDDLENQDESSDSSFSLIFPTYIQQV